MLHHITHFVYFPLLILHTLRTFKMEKETLQILSGVEAPTKISLDKFAERSEEFEKNICKRPTKQNWITADVVANDANKKSRRESDRGGGFLMRGG